MGDELDSGFEVEESVPDIPANDSFDVGDVMDEGMDFSDTEEFGGSEFGDANTLDIDSIMDEAGDSVLEEPEILEESEVLEEPEILEEPEPPGDAEALEGVETTEEIESGSDGQPADTVEQTDPAVSKPALNAMSDYLNEHNYGREDYDVYSQDPEWQRLNNDLLTEIGEEPIDYSSQELPPETGDVESKPALNAMSDYLNEHNYGREDYDVYSQDPEWQRLNNDLLTEIGEEPIDYSSQELPPETGDSDAKPALNAMSDYLNEHNYGREDYDVYSQDPEWQRLNNDLLTEIGEEPIEYPEITTENELNEQPEERPSDFGTDTDPGTQEPLEQEPEELQETSMPGEVPEETDEGSDDESPKVLTREITPEILESRERDTAEVLDNYRENLREYGVPEEQIEAFVNQEREKINAEYESLDHGDTSSDIYHMPTDWEEVADSLTAEQPEQLSDALPDSPDLEESYSEVPESTDEIPENAEEIQEVEINYDEIYEGIQEDALAEGFADIQIDRDPERLDASLGNFDADVWGDLSLDAQKGAMNDLADYVVETVGFENPPAIEYYCNECDGDYGGYDPNTNTLQVNEYMLYNSDEAADTIAHELWHAHQFECASHPQNARDYQYQYNFENYIPPELGQDAYEAQLVEAEARAFAAQFKDRLAMLKGRSR